MPSSKTSLRTVCIVFLVGVLLLSIAAMLFGIFMEGMRHSRPGGDQLDFYYFECCTPAAYFFLLLLISVESAPRFAVIAGLVLAAALGIAWLVYRFHKEPDAYGFLSGAAVIMLSAAFAAWSLHKSWREQ